MRLHFWSTTLLSRLAFALTDFFCWRLHDILYPWSYPCTLHFWEIVCFACFCSTTTYALRLPHLKALADDACLAGCLFSSPVVTSLYTSIVRPLQEYRCSSSCCRLLFVKKETYPPPNIYNNNRELYDMTCSGRTTGTSTPWLSKTTPLETPT